MEKLGRGAGPFATALVIYMGSLAFTVIPDRDEGTPLRRSDLARVALVGALGAAIAPAALVYGLQHAGATSASLLLNLEVVFTVLLAWLLYRESIGRRMRFALALMLAGGALLPFRQPLDLRGGAGLFFVALATFCWAADNTIARPLARRRARSVVIGKSVAGLLLSSALVLTTKDSFPQGWRALGLFGCGVVGYGLSLKLYVLAQRELGAARTGSVFGFAPLVGAAISFALGDRGGILVTLGAAALLCAGLALLATERPT